MPFPPYDAFGGFTNSIAPFARRNRILPQPIDLDTLNTGVSRIIDIYPANYAAVVRDNPAPFATLTSAQQNTHVAIIGAGMSGLCALYELVRCGLKPDIYEASGRIGGRCYTETFSGEAAGADPAEMGAMRFPDTAKLMWHYFKQAVPIMSPGQDNPVFQPFPNPGLVATALNVEGNTSYWISEPNDPNFGLPNRVSILGDQFDEVFAEETTVHVDKVNNVFWTLSDAAAALKKPTLDPLDLDYLQVYWETIIERFDHVSLEMFVRSKLQNVAPFFWTESDVRLFKAVGFGTGGLGQDFPTSMVDFIRYDVWDYHALYRWGPEYTSTGFARAFLQLSLNAGLPPENVIMHAAFNIQRNSPITVRLQFQNNSSIIETREYDFVIVATGNPAMMQPMLLDEGDAVGEVRPFASTGTDLADPNILFTKQVRESIRNVEFYPSTKIWVATADTYLSEPAWPKVEGNPVRWILSDRLLGQTAIFPNASQQKCAVLLTYQNGFDSLRYHPLPLPIPSDVPNYGLAANQLTLNYVGMSQNNPGATPANDFGALLNRSFLASAYGGANTFKIEWHNEPYFQGAFRLLLAGQYNYNAILAFQYTVVNPNRGVGSQFRRVFLAGESAFFLDGWIEGPLYAGVNAASAVLFGILGGPAGLRTAEFVDPDFIWKFRNNNQVPPSFWNDSMDIGVGPS